MRNVFTSPAMFLLGSSHFRGSLTGKNMTLSYHWQLCWLPRAARRSLPAATRVHAAPPTPSDARERSPSAPAITGPALQSHRSGKGGAAGTRSPLDSTRWLTGAARCPSEQSAVASGRVVACTPTLGAPRIARKTGCWNDAAITKRSAAGWRERPEQADSNWRERACAVPGRVWCFANPLREAHRAPATRVLGEPRRPPAAAPAPFTLSLTTCPSDSYPLALCP